jgi:hypothetical protein
VLTPPAEACRERRLAAHDYLSGSCQDHWDWHHATKEHAEAPW